MPSALVEKIRAKYGDAYSALSDDDLEAKVLAKYPQYAELASPKARVMADVAKMGSPPEEAAAPMPAVPAARERPSMFQDVPTNDLSSEDNAKALATESAVMGATLPVLVSGPVGGAVALGRGIIGTSLGSRAGRFIGDPLGYGDAGAKIGGVVGGVASAVNPSSLFSLMKTSPAEMGKLLMGRFGASAPALAEGAAPTAASGNLAAIMAPAESAVATAPAAAGEAIAASGASSAVPGAATAPARILTPGAMGARPGNLATMMGAPPAAAAPAGTTALAEQIAAAAKPGGKVWLELDAAGNPFRVLTPGQASAMAEGSKTFIRIPGN